MRLSVVGAGYVGLITSACFAEFNHEVMCVEKNVLTLEKVRNGISPIYEPGLEELLQKNIKNGRLNFTNSLKEALDFSDVIFICVGTPQDEDGTADLSYVEEVIKEISTHIYSYKLIIGKSTVPVNTHIWIKEIIGKYTTTDFDIASNPEFLREGCSVYDFMNPQRIIVGVESKRAEELLREIYKPFTEKGDFLFITTPPVAEIIKYASNSFLALKISYVNMLADLCEKVNADIDEVANGMGIDNRIGNSFLNAGIGYGGSCLPKDVSAFIKTSEDYNVDFGLLREVNHINKSRRTKFLEKVKNVLGNVNGKQIAVWGLSFKPNTDDIREAPSIDIINRLKLDGAYLRLYDPQAINNFRDMLPESEYIQYFKDKYDALKNSDALLIITEWNEFATADLNSMKNLMKSMVIIDGRNIYEPQIMLNEGFEYYCIGKPIARTNWGIKLDNLIMPVKNNELSEKK